MSPTVTLALRELRADVKQGFRGFRIFLACLALGVATIAAAGELTEAVKAGLRADARLLLGGDLAVSQMYRPLDDDAKTYLESMGRISTHLEMRAMVRSDSGSRTLVELKAVDQAYPLAGQLRLNPNNASLFEGNGGGFSALADPGLLARLGIQVGDSVVLGSVRLRIAGVIDHEPDKVASPFQLGPRLLVSWEGLQASGLMMPGSIERYVTRLALPNQSDAAKVRAQLEQKFPKAHWRIRGLDEAAPGLKRFLDNLSLFLTLTGLAGLLVGGIGVANAVKSHLDTRARSIAILKSIGAGNNQIFAIYGIEVLTLAVLGILLGLGLGLLIPLAALDAASQALPVRLIAGIYPEPLVKAALAGLLVALAFGIGPLAGIGGTSPAAALRALVARPAMKQRLLTLLPALPFALALALLVVQTSSNRMLAIWFVIASLASLILFRLLAYLLASTARLVSRHSRAAGLRLALGQLFRPGSPAPSVVVSLGIGLAVLTTLAQIESNLRHQIEDRLPEEAPAFFFIDIQPNQKEGFITAAKDHQARDIRLAPMIRGRVTMLNGTPAEEVKIDPSARWALDGDRGFSSAAAMPDGTQLLAGSWWDETYRGPALVSLDARLAKGLGLKVGDRVGVDILGRAIEAEVASLRDIDWSAASMNFAFLFSPGTLEGAPYTFLATAKADATREDDIERAVTDALPNVSVIRVRNALESVKGVLEGAGMALAVMAAATLPAGGLVLAGAVAASLRRRVYESVVLKVLGADRPMLFRAYLLEFLFLGLATSLLAGAIGTLAAFGILDRMMNMTWRFLPASSLGLLLFGLVVTLLAGHLVTSRALAAKAAPYLRNE
ncbi:MAG: FtsX-like permease family protein [Alphaproteobacteria bacterium]|nr:FtsX-like permease family protein [Alphaproteobacteria bacterium]